MRTARIMTACLILALGHHTAFAQVTSADVLGRVTDTSGASLPGATVTITNTATGVARTTNTTDTGDFNFTLLPIGTYTLQIELQGFQTYTARVVAASGDRARIDARLQLAGLAETVNVVGQSPLVQTDTATVGALVTEKAVQDLPVNGRNFVRLLSIVPGANEGTGNAFTGGNRPDDRRQTNAVSINGALDNQNNYLIDGFDNNERQIGTIQVKPSIDAIAEIKVQTNLYSAEVGRTAGGVVNIITKSGSNRFSGTAFEFVRNDKFDARNFFATTKPRLDQNQFGGSLGGPIQHNRTFFFADFEGFHQKQGVPYVITVPTTRMRQGDFSELSSIIYNPTTRQPFQGNVIPASLIDPIGQRLVNLYPLPNAPGLANNFRTTSLRTQDSNTADLRVDHTMQRGSLFVRYSLNDVDTYTPTACETSSATIKPGCAPPGGGFPGPNTTKAHAVQASYVNIFSPTLVSELRVGYNKLDIQSFPINYGMKAAEELGLRNVNVDDESSGLPIFAMTGYTDLGDFRFLPLLNLANTWQVHGTLTKNKGAHALKVGAGSMFRAYTLVQSPMPKGQYQFDSLVTNSGPAGGNTGGNTIASALLGYPSQVQLTKVNMEPEYSTKEPYLFIHDDWRVTSALTVNVGLRYDVFTPLAEKEGRMSNFDPTTGKLLIGGKNGVSKSAGVKTDFSNIAPRFGFAWTLPGNLVLRGGYGLSYFPAVYKSQALLKNAPFVSAFGPLFSGATSNGGAPTLFLATGLPTPEVASADNPAGQLTRVDVDAKSTRVQQFNIIAEKGLGYEMVVSAGYVGSRGDHVGQTIFENLAPPGTASPNPRRPYASIVPNVTNINAWRTIYNSWYDGMQVGLRQRLHGGLTFNTHYTLGHAQISNSDVNDPNRIIKGDADADVRHRWVLNINYALPFGEGLTGAAKHLAGGWQINAIAYWQTGYPVDVNNTVNRANTGAGTSDGIPPSGPGDRPNMVGDPVLPSDQRTVTHWFNTDAFVAQPLGTLGNAPYRPFHGPSQRQLDLSLFKDVILGGTARLQLRVEAFNVLNTVNFANPIAQLGSVAFGSISSTGNTQARQMQFGLKLLF